MNTTPALASLLARIRRRARMRILNDGSAWLAIVVAVFVFGGWIVDATFRLETPYRLAWLVLAVVAVVVVVVRSVVRPWRVPLSDAELALALERGDAALGQRVISAVEFADLLAADRARGDSPVLMQAVVADVERSLPAGREGVFDRWHARRSTLSAAVVLVAIVTLAVAAPSAFATFVDRSVLLRDVDWPRATQLTFVDRGLDGSLRVPERDDLTLRVAAGGVVPELVELELAFASGVRQRVPMTQSGTDRFVFTLQTVLEDVVVRARGGDGDSGPVVVRCVTRPRITDFRLRVVAPEYLGGSASELPEGVVEASVPEGGRIEAEANATKPLVRGAVVVDGGRVEGTVEGTRLRATWTPSLASVATFDVVDVDGLGAADAPRFVVTPVPDRTPEVVFAPRDVGALLTPFALVVGTLRADDDHGVTALSGRQRRTALDGQAEPPPFAGGPFTGIPTPTSPQQIVEAVVTLDLSTWRDADGAPIAQPGELLELQFAARDGRPAAVDAPPREGVSTTLAFRIVTPEKLLEDLRRRQLEQRRELQQTLDAVLDEATALLDATPDRVDELVARRRSLAVRVTGVADRYAAILAESAANRVREPDELRDAAAAIVQPLRETTTTSLPNALRSLEEFGVGADAGREERRSAASASLAIVVARLREVLAAMADTESLAELLEAVRSLQRLQDDVLDAVRKRLQDEAGSIFGPDPGTKPRDSGK